MSVTSVALDWAQEAALRNMKAMPIKVAHFMRGDRSLVLQSVKILTTVEFAKQAEEPVERLRSRQLKFDLDHK